MSLYVVSDLHIWGPDDPIYFSLIRLVREKVCHGDTVVLAGDLFDLFIGDKPIFVDRYRDFFSALEEASGKGVKFHYVEGNHDFMVRKAFRGIEGMEVHPDEVTLEFSGKRFLCAHGDTVDRNDFGYLFLRMVFRSPLMRLFVKLIPGKVLDWIGRRSSHYSRGIRPRLSHELPIERFDRIRKLFRNFAAEKLAEGFDYVIMGHCHDLDEMNLVVGGRPGQYVNMGYPRVHGSYLSWTPGDEKVMRERLPHAAPSNPSLSL